MGYLDVHKEKILELLKLGYTQSQIAAEFHSNQSCVSYWMIRNNIKTNYANKLIQQEIELGTIRKLIEEHHSKKEIASKLHTSAKRVSEFFKLHNLKIKKKARKRTVNKYWDDNQFRTNLKLYLDSNSREEKDKIFRRSLYPLLYQMSQIIWRRYFAWRNPELIENENQYKQDAVTCVLESGFQNYDFSRSSFSYFQTIIKNYFHEITWQSKDKEKDYISLEDEGIDFEAVDLKIYNLHSEGLEEDQYTIEETIDFLKTKFPACTKEDYSTILQRLIEFFQSNRVFSKLSMYLYLDENRGEISRHAIDDFFRNVLKMHSSIIKMEKETNDCQEYVSPQYWWEEPSFMDDRERMNHTQRTKKKTQLKANEE